MNRYKKRGYLYAGNPFLFFGEDVLPGDLI
jgi:hypothetical protein